MYDPYIKQVNVTFISWFNTTALYLQEHVMYEHYASGYESDGHV